MKGTNRICILIFVLLCSGVALYSGAHTKAAKSDLVLLKNEVESNTEKIGLLEKEKDLRNYLDMQFDNAIQLLENGNIDDLKNKVTSNIQVFNDRLICYINNNPVEFKLPEGDYHYRQRFYSLDNDKTFTTGYEIHQYQKPGEEAMKVCYITYILEGGQWKIDRIQVDIG